jgi:hypothetical protein
MVLKLIVDRSEQQTSAPLGVALKDEIFEILILDFTISATKTASFRSLSVKSIVCFVWSSPRLRNVGRPRFLYGALEFSVHNLTISSEKTPKILDRNFARAAELSSR